MASHIIFFQVGAFGNRQSHGAVLVHDIHICDFRIAVVFCHLIMHGCIGPGPAICRITFYDRGILKRLHQIPDQVCPKIIASCTEIVASRLSGGELHCDVSFW